MSEFIAERMWPEALVERSIFGTDSPEAIWERVLESARMQSNASPLKSASARFSVCAFEAARGWP